MSCRTLSVRSKDATQMLPALMNLALLPAVAIRVILVMESVVQMWMSVQVLYITVLSNRNATTYKEASNVNVTKVTEIMA